jgi:hypothetical protein
MSALPPIADIDRVKLNVGEVPEADKIDAVIRGPPYACHR